MSGPGTVPGAATTCTDDECDIMDSLDTLMTDNTPSGLPTWTLYTTANYGANYTINSIVGTGSPSWTLEGLAEHISDSCI